MIRVHTLVLLGLVSLAPADAPANAAPAGAEPQNPGEPAQAASPTPDAKTPLPTPGQPLAQPDARGNDTSSPSASKPAPGKTTKTGSAANKPDPNLDQPPAPKSGSAPNEPAQPAAPKPVSAPNEPAPNLGQPAPKPGSAANKSDRGQPAATKPGASKPAASLGQPGAPSLGQPPAPKPGSAAGNPDPKPGSAASHPDPNLGQPASQLPEPEPSTDGPITLVAEISPEPSNIGDLLTLTVTAAYPAGYSVNLPTGINFGSLHRVAVEESEPESTGTGFRKQFKISLQAFAVGEGRVPSFPLTYLDDKGEVHTVNAPATTFTVDSLLANENEPVREVEDPPISLEYPNDRLELVIYSALAALLLGFIGMMLWGRWRRRTKPVYRPPPTPAHEVALSALEELEQRSLVEDGKFQLYYLELTEITKGYIEGRFGIEALDRTTEEIRRELLREAKRIEPLNAKDVIDFLQACDLVKFARFAPPVDEASGALGSVRSMVEQSLPSLAPEQDPSAPETSAEAGQPTAAVAGDTTSPPTQNASKPVAETGSPSQPQDASEPKSSTNADQTAVTVKASPGEVSETPKSETSTASQEGSA